MASQSTGATTPSEKFSARLSMAARATPASSSVCGIAADDMRHRGAAGGEAVVLQARWRHRPRAGAGCVVRSRCRREARTAMPERQAKQRVLHDEGDRPDDGEQNQKRDDAGGAAQSGAGRFAIERAVERADQRSPSRSPDGRSRAAAAADSRRTSSISMAKSGERDRHLSSTAIRTNRCCTAAISPPRGADFPALPNLSSTCRPGSIPIPIRCRACRRMLSPACRIAAASNRARRDRGAQPTARRRRLTSCRRRARRFCCRSLPGWCGPAGPLSCRRPIASTRAARRSPATA